MKYFLLIIKHKWFVLLAGIKIGCPLSRLLLHDMSKFLPPRTSTLSKTVFW